MQKIGLLLLTLIIISFPSNNTIMYNKVVSTAKPIHATAKTPIELEKIQLNKLIKPIDVPNKTKPVKPKYSEHDLYCVTATIIQEAGSQECSDEMQRLVAQVIINRTQHKDFGGNIYSVLTAKHQYGMMWKYGVHIPSDTDKNVVQRCEDNAKYILEGNRVCPANVVYSSEFPNLGKIYKRFKTSQGYYYFNYKD